MVLRTSPIPSTEMKISPVQKYICIVTCLAVVVALRFVNISMKLAGNFCGDDWSSNFDLPTKSKSTNQPFQHHQEEQQALDDFRKIRPTRLQLYFNGNYTFIRDQKAPMLENSEEIIGGPILDFLITGFPKCGTTGMMRTLSAVATMPSNQDVCTPVKQATYYSYVNWPQQFGGIGPYEYSAEKPLKGSKCPHWIESGEDMRQIGTILPKTNLIVGIRHPLLWFQSFANQVL